MTIQDIMGYIANGRYVRQLRQERDDAHDALRQILGLNEDWDIKEWPEPYEGWVASLQRVCICDISRDAPPVCYCCDPDNLSPSALRALRRIR